ncbi:MAG: hypothetical protein RLZZ511_1461 [Cyanobacteriota bacterium]
MQLSIARQIQSSGSIGNNCDIDHEQYRGAHPLPLRSSMEFDPMSRSHNPAVTSATHLRRSAQRLGCCLSSLGLFGSALAYSQAIANAETSAPSNRVASRDNAAALAGTSPARIDVTPPERFSAPEASQPEASLPPLEVPSAAIAPEPVANSDPAANATASPAPSPTAVPPLEVVIEPLPATKPAPRAKLQPRPRSAAPAPAKSAAPTSDGQSLAKTALKKSAQQTSKVTPPIKGAIQPETAPIAKIALPNAPTTNAPAAVQIGPVNLSNTGMQFGSSTVQPSYYQARMSLPPMPGLDQLKMMFPIAVPAPITSLFGWRIHPISGSQRLHTGTDIGAAMGTPVVAAMPGRVILADNMGGYGITVALEHDNGMRQTLYAHLSELYVRPGDVVQQGTVVGRVGSTGASTGPHLHFELRQMLPDGTWVAQDASQHLERSMAQLVQSLQIAQQQRTAQLPTTNRINR